MFGWLVRLIYDPAFIEHRDFLKTVPLFEGLGNGELSILYHNIYERTYLKNEPLFYEGDIGRALFILVEGKILLTKKSDDGGEITLAELESGDYFGEMTLVDELPRSASAVAAEDSRLLLLYKSKLEGILARHPRIGTAIMGHLSRNLSARLRDANARLAKAGESKTAPSPNPDERVSTG